MKLAAARAIADLTEASELVPDALDPRSTRRSPAPSPTPLEPRASRGPSACRPGSSSARNDLDLAVHLRMNLAVVGKGARLLEGFRLQLARLPPCRCRSSCRRPSRCAAPGPGSSGSPPCRPPGSSPRLIESEVDHLDGLGTRRGAASAAAGGRGIALGRGSTAGRVHQHRSCRRRLRRRRCRARSADRFRAAWRSSGRFVELSSRSATRIGPPRTRAAAAASARRGRGPGLESARDRLRRGRRRADSRRTTRCWPAAAMAAAQSRRVPRALELGQSVEVGADVAVLELDREGEELGPGRSPRRDPSTPLRARDRRARETAKLFEGAREGIGAGPGLAAEKRRRIGDRPRQQHPVGERPARRPRQSARAAPCGQACPLPPGPRARHGPRSPSARERRARPLFPLRRGRSVAPHGGSRAPPQVKSHRPSTKACGACGTAERPRGSPPRARPRRSRSCRSSPAASPLESLGVVVGVGGDRQLFEPAPEREHLRAGRSSFP